MSYIGPYTFIEHEIHRSLKKEFVTGNKVDLNFFDIWETAWILNEENKICPLLASVDPYDNTIFNSHQCEILLKEIKTISSQDSINLAKRLKYKNKIGDHNEVVNPEKFKEIINLLTNISKGSYLLLMGD